MASVFAQSHTPTTFSISGLSREDACSKISAEISRLEDQIRSLYSLQNSLSPVSSLPTEILSKTFMHCCDLDEAGRYTDFRLGEEEEKVLEKHGRACLKTRLVVSWVSRQWRSVALGHKPLWNLIFSANATPHLDYARACMERCQNLYIDARSPRQDLFQLYTSHISQISNLKLKGPIHSTKPFSWAQGAPLLRSLTLQTDTPVEISNSITPGMCPQLRSLELGGIFNWNLFSSVSSTLTDLAIRWPGSRITMTMLIDLLESLPVLTKFSILDGLEEGPNDQPSSLRSIHLPQLQDLAIRDSTTQIMTLLHKIHAPAAVVDLIPWHAPDQEDDTATAALLHTLQLTQGHVWGSIRYLRDGAWLSVSSSLPLKHSLSSVSSPNNLLLVCQHLNLDKLESLWAISGSIEVMVELGRLPQLRTIWLECSDPLKAFVECMTDPTHNQHFTPRFPALQELILVTLDSGVLLGRLYDVLTARKIEGIGLQKLEFAECASVRLGDVSHFKKVVTHVEINDILRQDHPAFLDWC
ncbi:hypothetical protein BDN72DRAFT_846695, partial [Pluteus cervinus]